MDPMIGVPHHAQLQHHHHMMLQQGAMIPPHHLHPHHTMPLEVENDEKILADIAAEGRERYANTLVGRLAEFMRDNGEPVSLMQCTEALRDVFPDLKKPDGTRYKGSLERAIHGALWSTGVFRKIPETEQWMLKEEEAGDYERKLIQRFQERSKKRKNLSSAGKAATLGSPKKTRRKYTRKSGKRGDVIRLLASFSQGHKDAADRAAAADAGGGVPLELQAIFKNPFKGWTVGDSESKIRRKIGDDRYLLLMQMYHYFEDILVKALEPEELGLGMGGSLAGRGKSSTAVLTLQKQMSAIMARLANIESVILKPDGPSAAV